MRLRRLPNRVVAAILRSRAHRVLSGTALLLSYRGRRTGHRYTIPLSYARDGDDLVLIALHPQGQSWWRNLRGGAKVELLVAGRTVAAWATVVGRDPAARLAYARRFPWARPVLRRARGLLFVRVTPRE